MWRRRMSDDDLCGKDLAVYVDSKFRELMSEWPQPLSLIIVNAGSDVEDHGRGLRSWVDTGGEVMCFPARGGDSSKADYDRIDAPTRSGIDAQLREHVTTLQEMLSEGRRP